VAGHETFEQGTIHAVKIARGVGDIEQRLQVEMKGGVSERREVDESSLAKGGLQGESEVDGDGGGSRCRLWALTMENTLPRGPSCEPALSRSEANKGFEQVGGSGGTLDKFAGAARMALTMT